MIYDLRNPLDRERATAKLQHHLSKQHTIELKAKRPPRSLSQNAYLHLLLQLLAAELGCETQWVKEEYYKRLVNPDLFLYTRHSPHLPPRTALRSSALLSSEQLTLSIDRLKHWAAQEAGIYLPEATSEDQILAAQMAIERARHYL